MSDHHWSKRVPLAVWRMLGWVMACGLLAVASKDWNMYLVLTLGGLLYQVAVLGQELTLGVDDD